jgi:hypothetical protein
MTDIEIHGQMVFLETMSLQRLMRTKHYYEQELTKLNTELTTRRRRESKLKHHLTPEQMSGLEDIL